VQLAKIKNSVRFKQLMAMTLMLGNQINTGGSGTMAQGFTLDALSKFAETKTVDKKTSVLEYLVKLVRDNSPDLLCVNVDMVSVGPAQYVIIEKIGSELKEMTNQLTHSKATVAAEGQRKKEEGKARAHVDLTEMEMFFMCATEHLEEAHAQLNSAKNSFREILRYLGQDPTMLSADFFGSLNQFLTTFDAALGAEILTKKEAT